LYLILHITTSATVGPDLIFLYLDQLFEREYVVVVQLADIPGMERYESCCDNHFRNCHGALLICDSTDIDTLERTELYWYKQLQTKGNDNVEAVLVCNKIDLLETNCDENYRRIFFERAEYFVSIHNMSIFYISALHGDNTQATFKQLLLRILQNPSVVQELKENATRPNETTIYEHAKVRRLSSIQLSTLPSSAANVQQSNDENTSVRCCKFS